MLEKERKAPQERERIKSKHDTPVNTDNILLKILYFSLQLCLLLLG
jgi:hypothetical protein